MANVTIFDLPPLDHPQDDAIIEVEFEGVSYKGTFAQVVTHVLRSVQHPVSINAFVLGKPAAGQRWTMPVGKQFQFKAGLADSRFWVESTPTLACHYTIKKGILEIGTVDFAAGVAEGVITFTEDQTFVPGDKLYLEAPAVQDATLAGFSFNLVGTYD